MIPIVSSRRLAAAEKVSFCSDGVFLEDGSKETRIGAEDLRPYYPFRLPYIDDQSRRVAASADAQVFAMITDQLRIVAIDRSGEVLANLDPPIGDPEMVFIALSPDGRYLAFESDYVDQFLKVFDIQQQKYINLPQYNARQMRFSQDSQYLYIYEEEKSWEVAKLKVLSTSSWEMIRQNRWNDRVQLD